MAHEHEVNDTSPHFIIDPDTRIITNESDEKLILMQYDHNSTEVTFELPRTIDGHDMKSCNRIEIHYVNIGNASRSIGVYETKLEEDPEDPDTLFCSWLISSNATQYQGSLNFLVRFACVTDDVIDYAWSTAVYKEGVVNGGMFNSEIVVDQYSDVLAQWRNELALASTTTALIDIEELPTEDIRSNAVYRLKKKVFDSYLYCMGERNKYLGATVNVVRVSTEDNLPVRGHEFDVNTDTITLYYISEAVDSSRRWLVYKDGSYISAITAFASLGLTATMATDPESATSENTAYLMTVPYYIYPLYHYKDGWIEIAEKSENTTIIQNETSYVTTVMTETEMTRILTNATSVDYGKVCLYLGETTENYEYGAYYMLTEEDWTNANI